MALAYKRTWAGQDSKERVRGVAASARSPELQRAIARLYPRHLDHSADGWKRLGRP